ncbi:MAG TPA: rRNA cytosine-C5-methyltransferase [Salinivirgaceae bacterium]|nr:rRNA cytosine-C5-methyltransferase [Salinivirgaceae bacterium]
MPILDHLPSDFVVRIQQQLKENASSFFDALQQCSTTSIRLNPRKIKAQSETLEKVPWCANGFYLSDRINFTIDPWFQSGGYYVQEAGSMFIEHIVKHLSKETLLTNVLDLCAAPGGKTTLLASLFDTKTLIVANEVINSRAQVLWQNTDRWGHDNVVVTNNDPADFARLHHFFDLCLIDAPCSGEGLFRRDPDSIKQWNIENTVLCSQRQRRILMDCWPAIKPDGLIIYSTCTFNPAENEENLAWLKSQKDIEFIDIPIETSWGIDKVDYNGILGYRFLFNQTKSEGFFVAVFRKKEMIKQTTKIKAKKLFQKPEKNLTTQLERISQAQSFWQFGEKIFATDLDIQTVAYLSASLNVIRPGCMVASDFKGKLVPEHGLALSKNLKKEAFEKIDLTEAEAYRFFKNQPLFFAQKEKGRYLLTVHSLPIGFINHLGNRCNSSLPTDWRILRDFDLNSPTVAQMGFTVVKS